MTFETKMIQPVCLLLIQSTIMTIISVCDLVIPSFQKYFSLSQCGQLLEFSRYNDKLTGSKHKKSDQFVLISIASR